MDGSVFMNDPQEKALSSLSALIEKIALELVFSQPASDAGLLPINSFINDMEELTHAVVFPAPILDAIARGHTLIDQVFHSAGHFTQESLNHLNAWITWFQAVVAAINANEPAPEFNFVLATAETSVIPVPPNASSETCTVHVSGDALHLDLKNDAEVLSQFVQESREHLQNIESGALALEEKPNDVDTLNSIFRAFHTFKGGSGFLQLTPMNKLAHDLETLLDLARQKRLPISLEVVEIILNGGDTLKQFIDAIDRQVSGRAPAAAIIIATAPLHERIVKALTAPTQSQNSETATTFLHHSEVESKHVASSALVKVDTEKLDHLIDLVGEMMIAQSLVAQHPDIKSIPGSQVIRSLAQLAAATKDLQRTALSLRMVPIRGVFRKMTRVVRDLSMRSGKQIELILKGEETELDRNIIEEIHDPLLHMIRNSVDHGIEKPETRAAAGKYPTGRITLAALHQGGNVVIQIQDDGAGLNREKILAKAIAAGLINASSQLSDKEIFNLIFTPGFSTADEITDISGRGVGMDVVRRNIEELRGKIEIQSTPGEGATFSICLPLTLAIIDGLIIRLGEQRYILPTLSVRETFRPTQKMLSTVHGKGEIVDVRGRLLPLLRLNEFLAVASDHTDPTRAVLVVIESDGAHRALLVDEVLGKQEVVIKSLGDTFQSNPLLAGAAILGDGRVGLILDVHALVHPQTTPLSKAA